MSNYLLREVTREEWMALPFERSYGKCDEETGITHYYEILGVVSEVP